MDIQLCECNQHRATGQAARAKWLNARGCHGWRMAGASFAQTVSEPERRKAGARKYRGRGAAGASGRHMNRAKVQGFSENGRRPVSRKMCAVLPRAKPRGSTKAAQSCQGCVPPPVEPPAQRLVVASPVRGAFLLPRHPHDQGATSLSPLDTPSNRAELSRSPCTPIDQRAFVPFGNLTNPPRV